MFKITETCKLDKTISKSRFFSLSIYAEGFSYSQILLNCGDILHFSFR